MVTYGLAATPTAGYTHGHRHQLDPHETALTLHVAASLPVRAPLPGAFNVSNMLAAVRRFNSGRDAESRRRGAGERRYLSGRMERIEMGQPFLVIVDFAHPQRSGAGHRRGARDDRPDNRIIAVFGSAGKRDVDKAHRLMARSPPPADPVGAKRTAEDPRTESLGRHPGDDTPRPASSAAWRQRGRVGAAGPRSVRLS